MAGGHAWQIIRDMVNERAVHCIVVLSIQTVTFAKT